MRLSVTLLRSLSEFEKADRTEQTGWAQRLAG